MSVEHVSGSSAIDAVCVDTKSCDSSRLPFSADGRLRNFRFSPRNMVLTTSQKIVCQCIACGLSDKEIAFFLGIGRATVKAHTGNILRTLGLIRRTQLVRFVFESGDFDPEMVEMEIKRRSALVRRRTRKGMPDISTSLVGT